MKLPGLTVSLVALLVGCRPIPPARNIDPVLATYVPAGTIAVGGANLEALRVSPLAAKLPPALTALIEPYRGSHSLLAAFGGKDVLIIAGDGKLSGPADSVAAAQAQHRTGVPGSPDLLADAEPLAGGNAIWVVVRGGVTLPLTGNAANLNRLLRGMEYAVLTVRATSPMRLAVTARGNSADAALHFENTLRATLTMTAAAEQKQTDVAALLRSIQVRREDRTVHAEVSVDPDSLGRLLTW